VNSYVWRRACAFQGFGVCGVGGSGWFLKHERVCKGIQGASGYGIRIYAGPVSVNLTVQV
jgi:hypothetical protein